MSISCSLSMPWSALAAAYLVVFCISCAPARAADWRECERAKQRQLSLQQAARDTPVKTRKGGSRKRSTPAQRLEDIETWLWKHCREYSYELRDLEQDRM